MVLDGTLIPIDRVAADRPFYSGKHKKHGMNLQVIASPDGDIVWVSGALPGATHDLRAARIWGIIRQLAAAGLVVLADKGYHGAGEPSSPPTGAGTSPPPRKTPTAPTPGCAPRRTRQRPAQDLAHPEQTPLLPLARRPPRQSHPRPANPRNHQDEKGSLSTRLKSITVVL